MKKVRYAFLLSVLFLGLAPVQSISATENILTLKPSGEGSEIEGEWQADFTLEPSDPEMEVFLTLYVGDHGVDVPVTYDESTKTYQFKIESEKDILENFTDEDREAFEALILELEPEIEAIDESCDFDKPAVEDTDLCSIERQKLQKISDKIEAFVMSKVSYDFYFHDSAFFYGYLKVDTAKEFLESDHQIEMMDSNPYPDLVLKEGEYFLKRIGGYGWIGSENYVSMIHLYTTTDVYITSLKTYINGIEVEDTKFVNDERTYMGRPTTNVNLEFMVFEEKEYAEGSFIIKEKYLKHMSDEQAEFLVKFYESKEYAYDSPEYRALLDEMFSYDLTIANNEGKSATYSFMSEGNLHKALSEGMIVNLDYVNTPNHEEKLLKKEAKEPEQLEFDASILPSTGIENYSTMLGALLVFSGLFIKRKV